MDKSKLLIVCLILLAVGGQSPEGIACAAPQTTVKDAAIEPRVNPQDGLKYVPIPPGTYEMGCSEGDTECGRKETPPHTVTLTRRFWLGQTEVPVHAFKSFVVSAGRTMPPEPIFAGRSSVTLKTNPEWRDDQQPIVNINWSDAVAYCSWAGGRLPTEAEWEYAARAGERSARYGDPDNIAWNANNSGRLPLDSVAIRAIGDQRELTTRLAPNGNRTQAVGRKLPNRFGLFDMLGNAFEWVADWYGEFSASPLTDPTGPMAGKERVIRGGSFGGGPWTMQLSLRASDPPTHSDAGIGFRCALDDRRL